jgi:hypothetical protein
MGKYGIRQTLKYQANSRDPAVQGWSINKRTKATVYSYLITKIKHKIIIQRKFLTPFNILEWHEQTRKYTCTGTTRELNLAIAYTHSVHYLFVFLLGLLFCIGLKLDLSHYKNTDCGVWKTGAHRTVWPYTGGNEKRIEKLHKEKLQDLWSAQGILFEWST